MLLQLAADDPEFKQGMNGIQIGAIVAGIGVAGAGAALIFAKTKTPEPDSVKMIKRILGGIMIVAGVGITIWGLTFS